MSNKEIIVLVGSNGDVADILINSTNFSKYSIIKTSSNLNPKNNFHCDLLSKQSIDNFLNRIKIMKIHLLILNASITPKYYKDKDSFNFDLLNNIFRVNSVSYIYFIEKAKELNIRIKKILIISSLSAYFPSKKHIAYNASKSAQLSFFYSFKEKYPDLEIYIFLLSSTSKKKLDAKKISLKYNKFLENRAHKSKLINFSLKKTFVFFLHKLFT